MNQVAINIVEHVPLWYDGASFGYIPRSGIAGSSCNTTSNFLRTPFLIGLFNSLESNFLSSLYILDTSPLLNIGFLKIFS